MKREDNATFISKDGIERFRQPVQTILRVMGYLRSRSIPTQSIKGGDEVTDQNRDAILFKYLFNPGKRSEFMSRKNYIIDNNKVDNFDRFSTREQGLIQQNQNFIAKYSTI